MSDAETKRIGLSKPKARAVTFVAIALFALIAASCASNESSNSENPKELILMTHDSFDIGEEVIAAFEAENHATVSVLRGGDAGEMLTKAILTKNSPTADVMYGIDNTFLGRALDQEIFVQYRSPNLDLVPDEYRLDATNHVMPVNFGFVNINYDILWLEDKGIQPPTGLEALTTEVWRGKLVVETPATSSPGLAFLLTTIERFGESGAYTWQDYWTDLRANDVLVTGGWEDAYYTAFTLYGGDRPLVVSYTTSPAAEVFYSEGAHTTPPTGNVTSETSAFLQVEGIGILRGSSNEALAQKFVDFVMTRAFQEDFPTRMWVFPVNSDAVLPEVFDFVPAPGDPAVLDPATIAANREAWIDEWTQIVLR